jgi:hypothetical protein
VALSLVTSVSGMRGDPHLRQLLRPAAGQVG